MNYIWTKEFPTTSGWYWVAGGGEDENIQLLLPYAIEKREIWSNRRDEYIKVSESKNFEFAGPISKPVDEEK